MVFSPRIVEDEDPGDDHKKQDLRIEESNLREERIHGGRGLVGIPMSIQTPNPIEMFPRAQFNEVR